MSRPCASIKVWTRRAALAAALPLAANAATAEPLTVGVAAPLGGPSALLGAQVAAGARAAAGALGAQAVRVEVADDQCSAAGGEAAARRFVAAKARAATGFLCTEALTAALPILKDAGIPTITLGVRLNGITDGRTRTGWPVVRLGPRADSERDAAGRIFADLWRDRLFAIVDDGTIYGRELAESVRAAAEAEGLKPVFVDTFRPGSENELALIGRLSRAGATEVFVGGDREDIAIMGRDAAIQNAPLTFAGGESLRAQSLGVPLAPGTLMVGLPEWADGADPAALDAIRAEGAQPEGYALPAYAAVQIAAAALAAPSPDPDAAQPFLGRTFGTVIGPVAFDGKGDLAENPYRLFRFDGLRFVSAEVP